MMMECPRCGFQQPQDRYCANCGVDIEALSNAPEPFVQQLLKNQYFYLALAAVVLVGVYFTISKIQGPATSSSSVSEVGQAPPASPAENPVARKAQNPVQTQSQESANPKAKRQAPAVAPAQSNPSLLESSGISSEAAPTSAVAGAAVNATTTPEAQVTPRLLTTEFWEVPRESLTQIFSLSQILFEGSQSRLVMFPDSERLQSFLRAARKLSGGRNAPMTANQAINLAFVDALDREEGLALNLEVMPNKLEPGLGEIDLAVNFKGEASSPPIQWEASPSLRSKQVLLIAGLLPHRALNPELLKGLREGPMQILESPDFIENQTEFLIVIELK